jgi:CheY-like chemotaxis protein
MEKIMTDISLENKKILIVDDEPDVLDSLEELLDMATVF